MKQQLWVTQIVVLKVARESVEVFLRRRFFLIIISTRISKFAYIPRVILIGITFHNAQFYRSLYNEMYVVRK